MSDEGVFLYLYRGLLFKVADGAQPPKAGSLFFCRHLDFKVGERVLELGTGIGLAALLAAKTGCRVVATDLIPEAVECARENALLNGVGELVEIRLGNCYEPVRGERFDLICSNPPQMPTPPGREREDSAAAADNGGFDGWEILDRVIQGAPAHLNRGGRLVFTIFAFLGVEKAFAKLEAQRFKPEVIGQEVQPFPRIGYERIDYIRSVAPAGLFSKSELPRTIERFVIQGTIR